MKTIIQIALGIIILWLFPKIIRLMPKLIKFIGYVLKDIKNNVKTRGQFSEYGVTLYCGRQGTGKTIGMVEYLERVRKKYPRALIYTNFKYKHETGSLESWKQILTIRSPYGVIFGIDEMPSEMSSAQWQSFPPELMREIAQQRKQGVKIIGAAQAFKDVVVQIRRQTFNVVEAKTLAGRWTFQKCLDADDYNRFIDSSASPEKKAKIHREWRRNFIQTDELRALYDTRARVERMLKLNESAAASGKGTAVVLS